MSNIKVTISNKHQKAGIEAAWYSYKTGNPGTPMQNSEEFFQSRCENLASQYAYQFGVGVISSGDFVLRFTPEENEAINAAAEQDVQLASYLENVRRSKEVYLFDEYVVEGVQTLADLNLIAPNRVNEILEY